MRYFLLLLAVLLLRSQPGYSQQIPQMSLTTLSGKHLVLPPPGGAKPLIVLVTFTHKGSEDNSSWNRQFEVRYENDPRVDYVELADLQGVPSFVVHFILHGMRHEVKEPERSHLAPFFNQAAAWKKLVGYRDPDVTYVVVATPSGHVVWQAHGPASPAKTAALEAEIAKLTEPRR